MKGLFDQIQIESEHLEEDLKKIIDKHCVKTVFVVSGHGYDNTDLQQYFDKYGVEVVRFSGYTSNPKYEEICNGVRALLDSNAQLIVAVGGGSCIDSAKCIKMYAVLNQTQDYMAQEMIDSDLPFLAIPTTAGTGSDGNGNIVIYRDGVKKSLHHPTALPDYVLFEPRYLDALSDYHKRATLADAMDQCIESLWANGCSKESAAYAREGLKLALDYYKQYLNGDLEVYPMIQRAAYLSGRAINLSKTTAAHALSYKLSAVCNLPHGHAVQMLIVPVCRTIETYLKSKGFDSYDNNAPENGSSEQDINLFGKVGVIVDILDLQDRNVGALTEKLAAIDTELALPVPEYPGDDIISDMVDQVNPERLGNNPVKYTKDQMIVIYRQAFMKK